MLSSKYFSGRYAVCETCGEKPCTCPPSAVTPSPVLELGRKPASGNAIPFVIWDELIAAHELSIVESGVLLFLCRKTHGYGHHAGALISVTDIAWGLRIGRATTKRALERLSQLGLIERNRRIEPGATFKDMSAASIKNVPEPHIGSTSGVRPVHPAVITRPAASTSLIGARLVFAR